jgi:hypothetical protein
MGTSLMPHLRLAAERDGRIVYNSTHARPIVVRGVQVSASLLAYGARAKVTEEGCCRMCGRDGYVNERDRRPGELRELSTHHLIPQVWFKREGRAFAALRNCRANVVPLCHPCHRLVDGRGSDPARYHARTELRRLLGQDELAFLIQVRAAAAAFDDETLTTARAIDAGLAWLDLMYPRHPLPDPPDEPMAALAA